ncbi:MAG TPA: hypothetical protein VH251_00110 [Verrucomicrobiae bacterium]|nr:hypothetical protein [Verrucomicrobiae bacterium]
MRRELLMPALLVTPFTALADDLGPESQFVLYPTRYCGSTKITPA